MTREDVIEILARFVIGAKPCSQREIIDACVSAYGMLKEQPSIPSNLDEDLQDAIEDDFKAGAEWQREQYGCIPAEEAYMRGFAQGAKEERKDLAPLINRLCEAILFEWKDAADLARETLTQIKAQEE